MDPNYKNFLKWKKGKKGREFLKEKDNEEIELLKQQGLQNSKI